ncbi:MULTISPECIES: hypothetical protein [Priestia]|nr:hypothetical protein [Priestia megaterium]MBZ5482945.1 hypothetical protein [Bacillus sp. T_4]PFI61932.1 hypothetical protein COI68_23285 [Priestia megaterium]PGK50761.1 hypothetical protein CN918_32755 [Priestia megaterium]PGN04167.1 hypothetical protein CN955_21625 [Priestia megaterium]PGQ88108.1 hypothetical protein COA18_05860 [Priestia megaterium]
MRGVPFCFYRNLFETKLNMPSEKVYSYGQLFDSVTAGTNLKSSFNMETGTMVDGTDIHGERTGMFDRNRLKGMNELEENFLLMVETRLKVLKEVLSKFYGM